MTGSPDLPSNASSQLLTFVIECSVIVVADFALTMQPLFSKLSAISLIEAL